MMKWVKLALRNILRNKRRSFVTLIAICMGFAAISLYYGYIHHTYWALRYMAIHGEGLGHLRISKASLKEKRKYEVEQNMFSRDETEKVIKLIGKEKGVILSTPQINITGLVSNGVSSTVFIGQGVVPSEDKIIKSQRWMKYSPVKGKPLSDDNRDGVEMASALSSYLNLTPGKDGVVMTTTLSGQMNALDIKVNGVFNTGTDFSNDKYMRFNFYFVQELRQTQSAQRIVVLLENWKDTEPMRALLIKKLSAAGINCKIKSWNELSMVYSKVKTYLDAIFMFLFSIVLAIVVMTTINTMSMVVLERTQEIGTMRALGLKRKGVSILFALEGAFLGFFGSIMGIILHTCVVVITRYYPMHYTPPGSSNPVKLFVDMVPAMLFVLLLSFILLSVFAAIIPTRRAARKNIVDALGHV
jgi:putative ABC transport system permease protein